MNEFNRRSVLLAPTGRAAKVFSGYAGQPAYTIHKKYTVSKNFRMESASFRRLKICTDKRSLS